METKLSLRLWRVALWGAVTFLLFSVLFSYFFHAFIAVLIENRAQLTSILPGPLLPSIIAAVLVFLFAALSIIALWKFHLRREPAPLRCRFASYKGNAELCIRLLLLVLLLATGSCVPQISHFTTCRCCLFTVEDACRHKPTELPSEGFYDFDSYAGRYSGIYPKGSRGSFQVGKNTWFDKLAFEQVQVDRTRFGWPVQAITRDVVRQEPEWHVVFEVWEPANLVFWFLAWLCIQAMISLAKWLFCFNKSVAKSALPAGTA